MAVITVSPENPEPGTIARAAALIGQGRLVAFPTETVYGLGCSALNSSAVAALYEAKGRPAYNPIIVHVANAAAAQRLVTNWPPAAEQLAARWWPGPLTLVLPKSREIPAEVTAGLGTVAIRVPRHPVALALLKACGVPVAAPSANRSGEVSPTTAEHVRKSLGSVIPMILDGGPTDVGIESTVLDLSQETPTLLRPGMTTREEIEAIIGPVAVFGASDGGDAPRPAPGMLDRHYAPRARVVLFAGLEDALPAAREVKAAGGRLAALIRTVRLKGVDLEERLPAHPAAYAQGLYGALHRLDEQGADLILVERPPEGPEWAAVRDRLERAAR